jgi:hypothetical protein
MGVTQSNPNVSISSVVLSRSMFFSLYVFLCFFVCSLFWGLLLANSMAKFSHYFHICSKNLVRKMVLVTNLYPLQGANKVNGVCVFFCLPLFGFVCGFMRKYYPCCFFFIVLVTGLYPLQGANKVNGVCVFFCLPLFGLVCGFMRKYYPCYFFFIVLVTGLYPL